MNNIDGYYIHISSYKHYYKSMSNIDNSNDNLIHSEVKGIPITISSSICYDLANGNYHLYVNNLPIYNININQNDIICLSKQNSNVYL